ncbi:unnamed protein product [Chondrus crispus]|uniref:Uncharacterized protein n=1 Tax=Chondrus crispus TaxID=2769 RepID=R7QCP8_CHOCR|nr:unnamed protein product [Chondrus crispus]CDF35849.1 unnamed protein product [Chondrus crispus]|eukprot:XP_005715668.1 unnamed protein product [Chondrus crispus]
MIGLMYMVHQKMRPSMTLRFSRSAIVSKRHACVVPSSAISFHHRKPTRRRPVTFFTVQKSNARSVTVMTNWITNESVKKPSKR